MFGWVRRRVRHSETRLRPRFVGYAREQTLSSAEEHAGRQRIHQALGYAFRLTFTRQDAIARQPNGKYETFFADIPGPTGSPGSSPF
jgi:hypothetical protein